jgi:hypothetical protein
MRWYRSRSLVFTTTVVAAGVVLTAGCVTHNGHNAAAPSSSVALSDVPTSKEAAAALPPGTVGVSPAGTTTKISVPAQSTEEQYFQACHAAKVWMQGRPGDRSSLIEAYLAMVQTPAARTAGTWNTAWRELTVARQAAVIVAAQAAADDGCG